MSETPVLLLENAQIKQEKSVILDRIHLTMSAGDYFFLIGKTGSGKGSFLKALYGDVPFSH